MAQPTLLWFGDIGRRNSFSVISESVIPILAKTFKITILAPPEEQIIDPFYCEKITTDIDIIFHAAALKQVPTVESHPYEAVKTNIFGAYNVVKAAVARKVKNVVAVSTDKAVKPVNALGMT